MKQQKRIQHYQFGEIVVDGSHFHSDIIIFPERVESNWWRREGHRLIPQDLPFLKKNQPKILVIGQGNSGMMKISEEFRRKTADLGIELKVARTEEAVKFYNRLWADEPENLIGAMHLTC